MAVSPVRSSRLLRFGHESAGVLAQERGHGAEHGVTEAADVQESTPLGHLGDFERLCRDQSFNLLILPNERAGSRG